MTIPRPLLQLHPLYRVSKGTDPDRGVYTLYRATLSAKSQRENNGWAAFSRQRQLTGYITDAPEERKTDLVG